MGKNQSASNLTNIIKQDASGSISFMSGSTMLMALSNTGQMSGSAPAASAITASYADNFLVKGNLTAQTLVVQTITSSVDFVTGSTRFGSLLDNTHQFTGSVGISGSLSGSGATFSGVVISNNSFYTAVTSDTLGNRTFGGASFSLRNSTNEDFNIDIFNRTTSTWYNAFKITNNGGAATFSGDVSLANSQSLRLLGGSLRILNSSNTATYGYLISNNGWKGSGSNNPSIAAESGLGINFFTNGSTNESMTITSAGNVGIRTASPQASLHIAGLAEQNALTIGTSNAYEIFITGSDSANIYHASPNQAIYLNTNGGPLYLGPSNASTLLTITGSSVGIGVSNPQSILHISNGEIVFTETGFSTVRLHKISHGHSDGSNPNNFLGFQVSDGSGNTAERMRINGSGHLGVGTTNPLGTLSTIGGAVQIMGDYQNHQTIIKSAGAGGTFNGALTITIPEMSNANIDGYGGYSCEVYVAGYQGLYCHAWFSGYVNGGIVVSETTILRSSGGWSISQNSYGTYSQGFTFTIDYPSSIIHPTARIIFSKGGSPNSTAYPANSITAVFS
jgi:hypothetical protein